MDFDMKGALEQIRERIGRAAQRSGRSAQDVTLVAVSKNHTYADIEKAYALGLNDFGENRVQELVDKQNKEKFSHRWHLIGQLQKNKVKYVIDKVVLIHSVDRLSLAREIQVRAQAAGCVVPVLLQVNIGSESGKGGVDAEGLEALVRDVAQYENIRIKGLMAVPPAVEPELARPYFIRMRELFEGIEKLGIENVDMQHLSMGMSGDYECAIEEGASIVRIGTAIFGQRIY